MYANSSCTQIHVYCLLVKSKKEQKEDFLFSFPAFHVFVRKIINIAKENYLKTIFTQFYFCNFIDDSDLFYKVKQSKQHYEELLEDYYMDQRKKHYKAVLDDGEFSDEV